MVLCADTALLTRLARIIMCSDQVTEQDVQDVAIEYFNVVCGRIAAGLYQSTRISSRFTPPRFRTGAYVPETPQSGSCVLGYSSGSNENAQLMSWAFSLPKTRPVGPDDRPNGPAWPVHCARRRAADRIKERAINVEKNHGGG